MLEPWRCKETDSSGCELGVVRNLPCTSGRVPMLASSTQRSRCTFDHHMHVRDAADLRTPRTLCALRHRRSPWASPKGGATSHSSGWNSRCQPHPVLTRQLPVPNCGASCRCAPSMLHPFKRGSAQELCESNAAGLEGPWCRSAPASQNVWPYVGMPRGRGAAWFGRVVTRYAHCGYHTCGGCLCVGARVTVKAAAMRAFCAAELTGVHLWRGANTPVGTSTVDASHAFRRMQGKCERSRARQA